MRYPTLLNKTAGLLALVVFCLLGLTACWDKHITRSFYASGKVKTEATVKSGLLDGQAVMFYESGARKAVAEYHAGLLDGQSIAYFENGRKQSSAMYKKGYLDGRSLRFDEQGRLIADVQFSQGRVVNTAQQQ